MCFPNPYTADSEKLTRAAIKQTFSRIRSQFARVTKVKPFGKDEVIRTHAIMSSQSLVFNTIRPWATRRAQIRMRTTTTDATPVVILHAYMLGTSVSSSCATIYAISSGVNGFAMSKEKTKQVALGLVSDDIEVRRFLHNKLLGEGIVTKEEFSKRTEDQ